MEVHHTSVIEFSVATPSSMCSPDWLWAGQGVVPLTLGFVVLEKRSLQSGPQWTSQIVGLITCLDRETGGLDVENDGVFSL